jgi:tRNA(Ile)-lysidine synthase
MPLLRQENPRLAENVSAMALDLRLDEQALQTLAGPELPTVTQLRTMPAALQSRALAAFLEASGVKEPERAHIDLARSLVYSDNPSARAAFPGGVTICRNYDRLCLLEESQLWAPIALPVPGSMEVNGYRITARLSNTACKNINRFTVSPQGQMYLRPRQTGDQIHLSGGSKSLKKLFIDRKIPASQRPLIPVLVDDGGVLAVCGIGADLDRVTASGVEIEIEQI